MKVNDDFSSELEKLLQTYELEVQSAKKEGLLTDSTAKTYILHSSNFVKWCKGNFKPGGRNIDN